MEYHLDLIEVKKNIKNLRVGDILYLSGKLFTARDKAHYKMLHIEKEELPFTLLDMGLYHCGPLMKKEKSKWNVVSAGPTTSSRMEDFEYDFIKKFGIWIIIGKGGMGKSTRNALQKYSCIYASFTGGAGVLAANCIKKVKNVYWLDELGTTEAVWIFEVEEFGPLVIAMDSCGKSIYECLSN